MDITRCTATANLTSCGKRTPKYIVIHYTAGTSSKAGSAISIAKYFAKPTTKASADFIVDDGTIVQYNPDPIKYYCWAVGGKKYTSKSSSQAATHYGSATNTNCISIEMCSNKRDKKTLSATDTDWFFTDATIKNAIELTKYLMQVYDIKADHVIMHTNVTGKICPNPWCVNEAALQGWRNFKSKLAGGVSTVTPVQTHMPNTQPPALYKILVDDLNIRKGPGTMYQTVGKVNKGITYTIVEVSGNWGRLKSNLGWICIDPKYAKKL